MSPIIRAGDSIEIKHGAKNIHTGDVIIYGTPENLHVRRVISIDSKQDGSLALVKPDNTSGGYQLIGDKQIVGKVVAVKGEDKHYTLNSFFWRGINYLLSLHSYVSWRQCKADSTFWKSVNFLYRIRNKLLPNKQSIMRVFRLSICRAHRILRPYRKVDP
jgi:hypothetical protein